MSSTTTSAEDARAANILGALSLALVDRIHAAVEGETAAAALSALDRFLDAPPIGRLCAAVGRTSPATVRMVDRLERAGYVRRRGGEDARASHVALTAAGRARAGEIATARAAVLEEAVSVLAPAERAVLADLLGRVLEGVVDAKLDRLRAGEPASAWTCRLCDPEACGRDRGACPAARAAAPGRRPRGQARRTMSQDGGARRAVRAVRRAGGRAGTLDAP